MLIVRQPNGAGSTASPITTTADSVPVFVGDMLRSEGYTVRIAGITTGTVQIQSSLNGTDWDNEGAALTADGKVNITATNVQFVRAHVTVSTSISVVMTVAGRRDNDESR